MCVSQVPEITGNLDVAQGIDGDAVLRKMLSRIIRRCPLRRPEICEALSGRVGVTVTPFMLDCYPSSSKKHRFPAAFIEAFCEVIGDDGLQRPVMGQRLRQLVALGESQLEMERLRADLLKLKGPERGKKEKSKRSQNG